MAAWSETPSFRCSGQPWMRSRGGSKSIRAGARLSASSTTSTATGRGNTLTRPADGPGPRRGGQERSTSSWRRGADWELIANKAGIAFWVPFRTCLHAVRAGVRSGEPDRDREYVPNCRSSRHITGAAGDGWSSSSRLADGAGGWTRHVEARGHCSTPAQGAGPGGDRRRYMAIRLALRCQQACRHAVQGSVLVDNAGDQ